MPEPIDTYSDEIGVNIGPFGAVLNFSASSQHAARPGEVLPGSRVASIRMSLEHLKVMAYVLRKQIRDYEQHAAIQIPIPQTVLNGLRIGREDWDECWGRER